MWATERNNTYKCNSRMTEHTLDLLSHIDTEICTTLIDILDNAETKLHAFTYEMLPAVLAKPVSNKSVGDTHHFELSYTSTQTTSELLSTKTLPDLFVSITINGFKTSQHIKITNINDLPQIAIIIDGLLTKTIVDLLNRRQ